MEDYGFDAKTLEFDSISVVGEQRELYTLYV